MRNILIHTGLLLIALAVMIIAAGHNVAPKKCIINSSQKQVQADTAGYLDAVHLLTPLSHAY